MPITLAQAKVGMANHVDQQVIDQFRRGSMLLEALTFDNSVSPGTGGSTLTYGYTQLKTPAGADFRDINADYTETVADRETKSVDLKIFGGTFKIDRVLANTANGQINEVQFQLEEHIKATTNLFHYTAINGDKGTKGFDGLDTLLVGTSTEINADASKAIDLSTSAAIDANYKTVLDMLDEFLSELDGVPTMLIGNAALLTKIRSCARRAGYLTHSEDAFGRQMSGYNGIPFMDMQYYYDTAEKKEKPVVPITSREYGASSSKTTVTGLTDLYAVRLGLDGFHAVSPMGGKVISTTLPDFSTAGPVKAGDVEMVAATVLKKSRAAGVLRNFKVSCDFHELRDLYERIKAAASEQEMDAFYTGLLDEMMNGLLEDVKYRTPVDTGHLRRNWFITHARRSGRHYRAEICNNIFYAPYVENGHRIVRKGVTHGFVEGKHMLRDSLFDLQKAAPDFIKTKSEEFLSRMMEGK